jgi:hypothetical protein
MNTTWTTATTPAATAAAPGAPVAPKEAPSKKVCHQEEGRVWGQEGRH